MQNETKNLSVALRALSDQTRLKIVLMLEGKPRTVGEVVDFFDLAQPTISRHLQTLTAAGLVVRRREGQRVYYALNTESVRDMCIELTACFPCCCVTVAPHAIGETDKPPKKKDKTKPAQRRRKKTAISKPQGERP